MLPLLPQGWDEATEPGLTDDDTTPAARQATAPALDDTALAALITRIARQDERALEALYDATTPRVHALVLRIVRRHALADGVVEDTRCKV